MSKKTFKPRTLTLLRYNLKMNRRESESTVPTVTLAGKWMYEAGFRSGQKIQITVKDRELIIRIESDPTPYPPEKKTVINWERRKYYWALNPEFTENPFHPRKPERKKRQRKSVKAK